jgi:tetratricopeptide (TPR) repeat protein
MRRLLVVIVAAVCAGPVGAAADPGKAKAANTRGYGLHKQKKYKEAAIEYRAAIREDPSLVVAHYNLACVASLMKDLETALRELAWVADRASWDAAARPAAAKARTDRDLEWVRNADVQGTLLTGTDAPDEGALDLVASPMPELAGKPTTDARLIKAIGAAPGKHDERCSGEAFSAPLDRDGPVTVVATLRDGVAVLDAAGKPIARSEPLGCAGPRDHITALGQAAGILKPFEYSDRVLLNARLVVIQYWAGSKQNIAVLVIRDRKDVVRAFDAPLASAAGDGALLQTRVLGNLIYTAPGEDRRRVLRWDAASAKYVEDR